jgi:hypothetical protein
MGPKRGGLLPLLLMCAIALGLTVVTVLLRITPTREPRVFAIPEVRTPASQWGIAAVDGDVILADVARMRLPNCARPATCEYEVRYCAVGIDEAGNVYDLVFATPSGTRDHAGSIAKQLCSDLSIDLKGFQEWLADRDPSDMVGIGLSKREPRIQVILRRDLEDGWFVQLSVSYP